MITFVILYFYLNSLFFFKTLGGYSYLNPEAVMFVLDAHSEFAPSSGHLEKSKPLPKLWHSQEGPGFIHILPPISDGNCKVMY